MICTEEHLMRVRCTGCTARALSTRSLEVVDNWWDQGLIESDARDAYRYVWARSAVRSAAYDHWTQLPESDRAQEIAQAIQESLSLVSG